MSKVFGPAFSIEASGSVSRYLTFSKRKTGQQVRYQRKQKDVITAPRTAQRALYAAAVADWNDLDDEVKEIYREISLPLKISGYNLFVKLHIADEIIGTDTAYYGDRNYGVYAYGKQI